MNYKVVFLDIDGTILKPDHTYSPSTKNAILQLQAQNIKTIIATGRPLHEIKGLAKELNIDSAIGFNGACAIVEGKVIVNETFDPDIVEKIVDVAKINGHGIVLSTYGVNYLTDLDAPETKLFIKTFDFKLNEEFSKADFNQALALTVTRVNQDEALEYGFNDLIQPLQVNVPGMQHCYDIVRTDINKGYAVKKVLEYLQVTTEEAIAFGDGANDKEMMRSVGTSFAMGNADPLLFRYTTHRTTSVMDSGIYNGLKQIGLVE